MENQLLIFGLLIVLIILIFLILLIPIAILSLQIYIISVIRSISKKIEQTVISNAIVESNTAIEALKTVEPSKAAKSEVICPNVSISIPETSNDSTKIRQTQQMTENSPTFTYIPLKNQEQNDYDKVVEKTESQAKTLEENLYDCPKKADAKNQFRVLPIKRSQVLSRALPETPLCALNNQSCEESLYVDMNRMGKAKQDEHF